MPVENASKIRWGIIGCGNVTEVKSGPPYQITDGFELVAVMRRDVLKAKDYAERHGVAKYYNNAQQLIADNEVDAVYIATPPNSHKEYALLVAAAGKPCCIEKPLSPCYADSKIIVDIFEAKNLPLFVAYYRRTLPRFLQIKAWLDAGQIGKPLHINWSLLQPPSQQDISGAYNWRTDKLVAPGGYFDDLASHGLDLFAYLLGNMEQVQGIAINQQKMYTAYDAVTANWLHGSGVTGSGVWNFGSTETQDLATIYGSKGHIQFGLFNNEPVSVQVGNSIQHVHIEHPKHVQLHHVEAMRQQLLGDGTLHPSTGTTALHTSWVMDKILGVIA